MMKLKIIVGLSLLISLPSGPVRGATQELPDFKEVYDLLRANLAGADDTKLNRAAVQGLLNQLSPRVTLVRDAAGADDETTNSPAAFRTAVLDGAYGYVRVGQVGVGIEKKLSEAYQQLTTSNRLKGVVFDLRFAGGEDYAAAAAMADWFYSTEKPLLDWGEGMKTSTLKTNAVSVPVTLLVNKQTSGAAEAFAGILRHGEIALLIGSNTAGQASIGKEFVLKTGQRLRVATTAVKLGNGEPFPMGGLKPDIQVDVSPEDELAYFEDAYKVLPRTNALAGAGSASTNDTSLAVTNRNPRRRINEAELVRMLKEGQAPDLEPARAKARDMEPARPIIYDPALARAVDLLKGLAVVQQFRSI